MFNPSSLQHPHHITEESDLNNSDNHQKSSFSLVSKESQLASSDQNFEKSDKFEQSPKNLKFIDDSVNFGKLVEFQRVESSSSLESCHQEKQF